MLGPDTAAWRLRLEDVPLEMQMEIRALHRVRPWANLISSSFIPYFGFVPFFSWKNGRYYRCELPVFL